MEDPKADLDVELFISEVRHHETIWNIRSEEYRDKAKKQAAWDVVCSNIIPGFSEKPEIERETIVRKLSLKWKNIKDNFARNVRKKRKLGQSPCFGRPYIYAAQLAFLKDSIVWAVSQPSEDESINYSSQEDNSSSSHRHQDDATDTDRSFFNSLIPLISNFTEDQKLDFRCEVINLIRKIKGPDPDQEEMENHEEYLNHSVEHHYAEKHDEETIDEEEIEEKYDKIITKTEPQSDEQNG